MAVLGGKPPVTKSDKCQTVYQLLSTACFRVMFHL